MQRFLKHIFPDLHPTILSYRHCHQPICNKVRDSVSREKQLLTNPSASGVDIRVVVRR